MKLSITTLILLAFITLGSLPTKADSLSAMSEAELASYISGRLSDALKDSEYKVKEYCDDSGCSVVVQ